MTSSYTLHLPENATPGETRSLEEARLVRDGFSWGAFLFTFFWFFAHRLWLAGLAVLAAMVALHVLLWALSVTGSAAVTAQMLLSALVGFEAASLRAWTYRRTGHPAVAVVAARNEPEAEVKAFSDWLDRPAPPRPLPSNTGVSMPAAGQVLGLFPRDETRR